jgi:hypothetical protein
VIVLYSLSSQGRSRENAPKKLTLLRYIRDSRSLHSPLALAQKHMPPSAPVRTLQESGQDQAIARPKGGPPSCSVPVPSTRWAASGASPPLKKCCACLCQDKLTHAHVRTCATQRDPREKKSRRKPAAGASEPQNVCKWKKTSSLMPGSCQQFFLENVCKRKQTSSLMPGSRQQIFLVVRETLPKEHLSVIRSERQIFSLALLTGRATPNIQGSAARKAGRVGAWNIHARHQHGQQGARRTPAEYPCMTAVKAAAMKAVNARGRDQWMRATLVCRHKRRRAAWRTRGGGDSFSA